MPCRLADVRTGAGMQRLDATIVRVPVVGQCGVPSDATAVALTVTVDASATGSGGYVSIWPEGLEPVTASVVNHWGREVRANGAIVGLEAPGTLAVLSSTGAPVVLDVTGWFVPATASAAGRFVPIAPTRAIDTREAPRRAPLAAGETVTVPLPPGVPADAAAVAITVTTTQSPGPGFLSVAPGGSGRPPSSALNTDARNQTRAAGAIVGVTPAGIDVYSLTGGHVIVDVTGWFTGATTASGTDGLFVAERTPAPRARHAPWRPDLGGGRHRDPERGAERGRPGAERRDRAAAGPRLRHRPPRLGRGSPERARSTAPPRARSPPRWRSCRRRPLVSACTRRAAPTWWPTCPAGSPAPRGRRRAARPRTCARPSAVGAPARRR